MIYIKTKAYNAEKTIARTIESVLSQTYGDFTYYVCNNGSLDETGTIIHKYADLDKRIIAIEQFPNCKKYTGTGSCCPEMEKYIYNLKYIIGDNDWYSMLDADDDIAPTFFEELIRFANLEDLDFAACRSNFIKVPDGIEYNEFILEKDLLMKNKDDFDKRFPEYFRFMGAGWGKLQRGSLFHRFDNDFFTKWESKNNLFCRGDTASQFFYLLFSERAGVKAKALHNYHIYPKGKSLNTQNLEGKLKDNLKMPDIYREFLTKKVGYVSEANEKFIQEVFERSQRRTYEEMGINYDSI